MRLAGSVVESVANGDIPLPDKFSRHNLPANLYITCHSPSSDEGKKFLWVFFFKSDSSFLCQFPSSRCDIIFFLSLELPFLSQSAFLNLNVVIKYTQPSLTHLPSPLVVLSAVPNRSGRILHARPSSAALAPKSHTSFPIECVRARQRDKPTEIKVLER